MIDLLFELATGIAIFYGIISIPLLIGEAIRWIKERRYAKYQREWFAAHPGADWNDFVAYNRSKK